MFAICMHPLNCSLLFFPTKELHFFYQDQSPIISDNVCVHECIKNEETQNSLFLYITRKNSDVELMCLGF